MLAAPFFPEQYALTGSVSSLILFDLEQIFHSLSVVASDNQSITG